MDKNINIDIDICTELFKFNLKEYNNYVLWSGGFDSTLLVFNLLQMHKNKKISKINLVYNNNIYISKNKRKKEEESRKKLLKIWKTEYNYDFNYIEISFDIRYNKEFNPICHKRGLFQQPMFISELYPVLHEKSIIHLGYISNDNNYYIYNLRSILKNIDKLIEGETLLSVPLMHMDKINIIKKIIKINPDLLNIVWICENPICENNIIKPCYKCNKCKELYNALLSIQNENKITNTNKLIKKIIEK